MTTLPRLGRPNGPTSSRRDHPTRLRRDRPTRLRRDRPTRLRRDRPARLRRDASPRRWRGAAPAGLVVVALAALGATGGAAFSGPQKAAAENLTPTRLSGSDRFATAAAVSAATFPNGAPVAYVATGDDFPDALAAAADAGGKGPVLLVDSSGLPSATAAELQRLHPSTIDIVGGIGAVPSAVRAAIESDVPSATTYRISGADRYATAAMMSQATFPGGANVAYVATGADYPDALAAAGVAGGQGPVLLVGPDGLPSSTSGELTRLNPSKVVVVGGIDAVPSGTKAAIENLLPNADVLRASGDDRFSTAANLASYVFANGAPVAYLATGNDFPDALAAAAAAGGRGPVLLVMSDEVPESTETELGALDPDRLFVVGGTDAVSDGTAEAAAAAVSPAEDPDPTTTADPPTTSPTTTADGSDATTTTTVPESDTVPPLTEPATPPPPPSPNADIAVQTAEAQIGKPYAWGGAGPDSYDCSGLTMYAWAAAGVTLPHNAAMQSAMLPAVYPDLADLQPGDLIFYDDPIDHVTMYVGDGMMVEAAHTGVPVRETPFRTDDLMGAGRP